MTQQLTIDHPDASTVAASPRPAALQEVIIYGHSTLLYWWPAWCFGFVVAILNAGQEKLLPTIAGGQPQGDRVGRARGNDRNSQRHVR